MDQEVVDYISQAQKHGLSDFEIKDNLLNVGWDATLIEQSFVFARATGNKATLEGSQNLKPAQAMPFPIKQVAATSPQSLNQKPVSSLPQNPSVAISDGHFQKAAPSNKTFFKKTIVWVVLAGLLLIAGGAYGYYNFVLASPTKVWQKFSHAAQTPIYQTKFKFSYSDPGEITSNESGLLSFQLKDIKLELKGSSYVNAQNAEQAESNSKIQYTFSSGNTSFSTGFEYLLQNKVLYLNVGDNPILNLISNAVNSGQKIDWIKIDLNQLQNQASSTQDQAKFFQQLTSPDFKNELAKIWANATIIKVSKYIGREKINGVTTLHFQNSIDKQALKGLAGQYVQELSKAVKGTTSEIKDSDVAAIDEVIAQLIDKLEVKEFDTWVGMTDFKLYRVHLLTNSPSFISLAKNAGKFNLPESSDAKRLADIRQMASALELYFNDHNGYPEGSNGQPVDLTPNYIGLIPQAPLANGNCSDYYNSYWYQPKGKKTVSQGKTVYSSYELTFCLGGDTGGYKAGIAKLSPAGISDNITCPSTPAQCVKATTDTNDPNASIKQQVQDFIGKLDFSAQIKADADYTDYGKKLQLTPPADSFDILQKFKDTQTSYPQS